MNGKVLRTDGKVIQEFTVHPLTIHGWKSAQDSYPLYTCPWIKKNCYIRVHCTCTDIPWMSLEDIVEWIIHKYWFCKSGLPPVMHIT